MHKGRLFIFTGPSGTGKGTILKRVLEKNKDIQVSVSATTRAPRIGEVHGIDYWFLQTEQFEQKIKENAFLEYACYVENYYGTLEEPVNMQLEQGFDVVLEIEVQGALQVAQKRPDAILIFVAPPSMEVLETRLRERGTENAEKIQQRLMQAEKELACQSKFAYCIINDELDEAVCDFESIVRAEHCRVCANEKNHL